MYVDLGKIMDKIGKLFGFLTLIFGLASYGFSITIQEQTAAALTAIFGLQVLWFLFWLNDRG